MRFNKGDDVIVAIQAGYDRPGKFIEVHENKLVVCFGDPQYDEQCDYDPVKVRKYQPIDDEVTDAWCKAEAPKIVDIIQRALKSMFPGYSYRLTTEDGSIELDGYSLMPATLRINSIGCVREVPGFQLVSWTHHPSTRHEPEDVTDTVVSEHRSALNAAEALIRIAINNYINHWFVGESEVLFCQSIEEEQEYAYKVGSSVVPVVKLSDIPTKATLPNEL